MKEKNVGFSLIELLAVIAIIGILTSILIPVIGHGIKSAHRTKAASNLRQIALVYANMINTGKSKVLNNSTNANEWASKLAEQSDLNDPTLFILDDDYLVSNEKNDLPISIGTREKGNWIINEIFSHYPLSFTIITNLSVQGSPSKTPIAYTRGLNPDTGQWDNPSGNNGGVYGNAGGFIAFLDGHVEFFQNLNESSGKLLKYGTNQPTSKIQEAVNEDAKAINWKGTVWISKK